VGVVKDSKYRSVDEEPIPMAYYPYTQVSGVSHLEVEVRTRSGHSSMELDCHGSARLGSESSAGEPNDAGRCL